MIRALVFDLDDTLYVESDFVTSGYRAVARYVAGKYGPSYKQTFHAMMSIFLSQGRKMVLPMVRERFLDSAVPLTDLVEVYRQHRPRIRLLPGYAALLKKFRRTYRLGIITDGLPEVQERKVRALGLAGRVDQIIYTWAHGSEKGKPHPLGFSLMLESLEAEPRNALFVGNDADKDGVGAHGVGMKYAHVQVPSTHGQAPGAEQQAEFVIDSLYELPQILARLKD